MDESKYRVFTCFAAEDRYRIVEPVVFHLRNYGISTWYDRQSLALGDNRKSKNLIEGATECRYALAFLSKYTADSQCAMEELSIVAHRYRNMDVTVFPVLYELAPNEMIYEFQWIKEIIFKEVDSSSGSREICNHIACQITNDMLKECRLHHIHEIFLEYVDRFPIAFLKIMENYSEVDSENLNARVSLLYAAYLVLTYSKDAYFYNKCRIVTKIFDRLFSETKLCISVDYRELWLLENSTCILASAYIDV